MALIWTFLSVILILYLFQQFRKKKRFPPGPTPLPIFGHFHLLGKNPHHDLSRLALKYGPLMGMRFGFKNAVVVSSPAAAELILKTHDLNFASRPYAEVAKYVGYEQRDLAFIPYGPDWRNIRKLCTLELFSSLKISQFRASRRAELGLLVDSLKQSAKIRETVNLSNTVFGLIWDMTCVMVLGSKYLDKYFYEKGFKSVFHELSEVAGQFNLADYFPYIGGLDLQGLNHKMKKLSEILDGFIEKIIDDHVQNKEEKKGDFVDTIMAILESGEAGFDRRHAKGLLLPQVIGGNGDAVAQSRTLPPPSPFQRHPRRRPDRDAQPLSLMEQCRRALTRPFSEFSGDGDGGSQTQRRRALDVAPTRRDSAPFPLAATAQPNTLTGIEGFRN